jgi:hypothetical protein
MRVIPNGSLPGRIPVSHDRGARQVRQPGHDTGIVRRARSHGDAVTPVQQPGRQRPADRPGSEHRYAHFRGKDVQLENQWHACFYDLGRERGAAR